MGDNGSFGWLKNALIKSAEETTTPVQQSQPTQTVSPRRMSAPAVSSPVISPSINEGELDDQYINHLMDFMVKCNIPGPDYLEFARSLDEMISEMGTDVSESKIYQMTYKVGYKQSLPVVKLVDTANQYISLFNQHKKEFDGYLDAEHQKTIGSKIEENKKLTTANSDAEKKIKELEDQITKLKSTYDSNLDLMDQNEVTITTAAQTLETKKVKFETAFKFVVGKVTEDINKINTYLKDIQ
jgi:hypothetical protein